MGITWYVQEYIDRCISRGEGIACVSDFLLPRHIGSHAPSSEDLSPFLEEGCCYAVR